MAVRILMTGASGFVGPYLCRALLARFPDATLIGLRSKRPAAPVGAAQGEPPGGESPVAEHPCGVPAPREGWPGQMLEADLADHAATDAAVAEARPDWVLHLAAQASVGRAQAVPDRTWLVNVGGTLNLALALARRAPEASVLFASSAEVYGGRFCADPVGETVAPCPLNPYARSKTIAERLLADVLPATARLIVARPFNHTGPGQREDFVLPSFARQIARIEVGRQPPVLRVGNLDAARDFLDVDDVVNAYIALIAAGPSLPERFTVNVASGRARRLSDLLDVMRSMARRSFQIEVDPSRLRPSDVPVACGDAALLRRTTGWAPAVPIERTLAGLLDAARAAEATR